jgi:glycosyltransferase involved in cell wall biosynthesis
VNFLSLWVAIAVCVLSAVKLAEAVYAVRVVRVMPEEEGSGSPLPALSVIVPAKDEEGGLETALASLLAQEYPGLEIVPVDDRSTDGTRAVMERLAGTRADVSPVHIEELPNGWLGKNHAVHVGASRASGEWLLLTDADVRFRPNALRLAVAHAERADLDHLALIPRLDLPGYWLRSFVAFFFVSFLIFRGYYRANVRSSKIGVGIGAFNLVRRTAFDKAGGYAARPLHPTDDLSLGGSIKGLGLRQELRLGQRLVSVPWYGSLGEMVRGVEKNVFPVLDYSVLQVVAYSFGTLVFAVWPFAGIFLEGGVTRTLLLVALIAQLLTFVLSNRFLGWRVLLLAVAYPVCAAFFAAVLVRSSVLALLRGGIYWRGTFYPLSMLRRGT